MAGSTGDPWAGKPAPVRRDRWAIAILFAGFAAGAAIGLGLPALVVYQLRADPVDVPGEWRTETSPASKPASGADQLRDVTPAETGGAPQL